MTPSKFKVQLFDSRGREIPLDDSDPATIEIARILAKWPERYGSRAEVRRMITRVCDRHNMTAEFD